MHEFETVRLIPVWAPLYVGFTVPFDKGPVISYNDSVTMDSLLTDSEDVLVKTVETVFMGPTLCAQHIHTVGINLPKFLHYDIKC
jgi:hypothetical protein